MPLWPGTLRAEAACPCTHSGHGAQVIRGQHAGETACPPCPGPALASGPPHSHFSILCEHVRPHGESLIQRGAQRAAAADGAQAVCLPRPSIADLSLRFLHEASYLLRPRTGATVPKGCGGLRRAAKGCDPFPRSASSSRTASAGVRHVKVSVRHALPARGRRWGTSPGQQTCHWLWMTPSRPDGLTARRTRQCVWPRQWHMRRPLLAYRPDQGPDSGHVWRVDAEPLSLSPDLPGWLSTFAMRLRAKGNRACFPNRRAARTLSIVGQFSV